VSHLLEIFYSAHCLGCPEARQAVRRFASSRPDVVVVEHDLESEAEFELAKRYGLIATPALVIDGGAVMYGVPLPVALAARVDASHRMVRADGEAR
jgi:glutaredoxin-related protein